MIEIQKIQSHPQSTRKDSSASIGRIPIDAETENHTSRVYWDWSRLFETDAHAGIEQHPDHLLNLAAAARRRTGRQAELIRSARDSDWKELAVLIPKDISTRRAGGFGPSWTLRGDWLAGNRLLAYDEASVASQFVKAVADIVCSRNSDFLLIEDLDSESPLRRELQNLTADGFHIYEPQGIQPHYQIEFSDQAEDYWSQFSRRRRSNFRREIRQAEPLVCQRVTSIDQVDEFLEIAHAISKNSWQSKRLELRIRNDDTERAELTFLALQGALRSYLLFRGDDPMAFAIGQQSGGLYYYVEIGFDQAFAHLSPGRLLLLKILEDLFDHDTPKGLDFGVGHADYKHLFSNRARKSGDYWLVPRGLRQRAMLAQLSLSKSLRKCSRSICERTGIWQRLRQRFRQS